MISFYQFEKYINKLKRIDEYYNSKYGLYKEYSDIVSSYDFPTIQIEGDIISLLTLAMGLPEEDDTISWWIYETNYGEMSMDMEDTYFPEESIFRHPDLSTTQNLYNYLVAVVENQTKN